MERPVEDCRRALTEETVRLQGITPEHSQNDRGRQALA
jgi:hypothetical protein